MAKYIDPTNLKMLGGALAGGALMEDEQDFTGTALGLAVGGFTGSMLDLDFKNIEKVKKQTNFKIKSDVPEKEIDTLRESMLEEIRSKRANLQPNQNKIYEHLVSDPSITFNTGDAFNTITNENLESIIQNTEDLSLLKKVRSVVRNEESINSFSPLDMDLPKRQNPTTHIRGTTKMSDKVAALTAVFTREGYVGKELDDKLAIFSNLLDKDTDILYSHANQNLEIGDMKFKISSNTPDGISSYVDTNNYWAVQKLNPFSEMYTNKYDGEAMAKAIGITFGDAADSDRIKKVLEEGAEKGMKPEDIKALLMANSDVKEADVDIFIDKAYQHQAIESGKRAIGQSRGEIERGATDIARRTSDIIEIGDVLNLDRKTKTLNTEAIVKPLGTVAKGSDGSAMSQYLKVLGKNTGIENFKYRVSGDAVTSITMKKGPNLVNAVSPAERNQGTTGSRDNVVSIKKDSKNATTRAYERLIASGRLPAEYATAIATSRYTVEGSRFNEAIRKVTDSVAVNVADGASVASREGFSNYSHTMFNQETIKASADGKLVLSSKVQDHIERTANGKFQAFNLPELNTIDLENTGEYRDTGTFLSQQKSKLDEARLNSSQIREVLATRASEGVVITDVDMSSKTFKSFDLSSDNFSLRYSSVYNDSSPLKPFVRNSVQTESNLPSQKLLDLGLSDVSNTALTKDLERAVAKEKAAETNIIKTLEATKNYVNFQANDINKTAPVKKALSTLVDSIDSGNLDVAVADVLEYDSLSKFTLKPGEYLGSNSNGSEVKVSDRLNNYKLIGADYADQGSDKTSLRLLFEGQRVVGEEGSYVKTFATDAKENNIFASGEDFIKAQALANLEAKGFVSDSDADGNLIFKKPSDVVGGNELVFDAKNSKEMFEKAQGAVLNSEISVISDADGVGLKMATDINKGYVQNNLESVLTEVGVSDHIKTNLMKVAEREAISDINYGALSVSSNRSSGWALGMFATALTEGKASSGSVMGMQILGDKNLEYLLEHVKPNTSLGQLSVDEVKRSNTALEIIADIFNQAGSKEKDILDYAPDEMAEEVRRRYSLRSQETAEAFKIDNLSKIVGSRVENGVEIGPEIFDKKHTDMFKLAYMNTHESIMLASADMSPTYNYGSGGMDKSMSYNAQTQLLYNGFDYDDIALFGSHDKKAIYDMNMINYTSKKVNHENTLNHFFQAEGKDSRYINNFMESLRARAPQDVQQFLTDQGVYDSIKDQDYLFYTVKNKTEENFRTIAIPKQDSDRTGFYVTPEGHTVKKPLGVQIIDLVQKDLALSVDTGNEKLAEEFAESASILKRTIVDTIGSRNNPALKGLFALQAPNSSYSVILPAGNDVFDNLVKTRAIDGESIIGISESKARQILENQGMNVEDIADHLSGDDNRILMANHLVDGEGNRAEMLGLESREPTYSGNSIRTVKYHVFKDSQLGETNTSDAVFHSIEDRHYSKLMFGDYDLDHALVYNFKEEVSQQQYDKLNATAMEHQQYRNRLLKLGDNLGIKGGKKNPYSLDIAVEQVKATIADVKVKTPGGPTIKPGSEAFYTAVIAEQEKRLQAASLKAGKRKVITPKITQLAMHLSESIDKVTEVGARAANSFDKEAMRTMSHYLVENLIKNQHAETVVGVEQSDVERLIQSKTAYVSEPSEKTRNAYRTELQSSFDNLLEGSSDDIKREYKPHIKAMVDAEIKFANDPKRVATQVVDIPKNVRSMLEGDMRNVTNITESIIQNMGILPQEDLKDVNIERTLKNGYNEISSTIKDNLSRNTVPLAIGAGLLAAGALMTQKDPDFGGSQKPVRGDIGSMMLTPNVESQQQASKEFSPAGPSPAKDKTGYITPNISYGDIENTVKQTARVVGSYNNLEQDMQHSMKKAIFGNNVSSVRIDKSYDY